MHACSAICEIKQQPEQHVHEAYRLDTYLKSYDYDIIAMPGPEEWLDESDDVILPPLQRVQASRPRKVRRRDPDEPVDAYKLSRRGYVVKCGNCGAGGHNIRSCPQPFDPNKKVWKKKTKNSAATVMCIFFCNSLVVYFY